jgi:hypothetical protein
MTSPGRDTFVVYAGLAFSVEWLFEDEAGTAVGFTGYTGRADVRAAPGGALLLRCDSEAIPPTLTFPADGVVRLSGDAAATAELVPGAYLFDLALAPPGGAPEIWLTGGVEAKAAVTEWGP